MSHPKNKHERFLIGCHKAKNRVLLFIPYRERIAGNKLMIHWARRHRKTTKTCSCPMCGNPRRYFNEETVQEKRFLKQPGDE